MTINAISSSSAAINQLVHISPVKPVRRDHPQGGARSDTPSSSTASDGKAAQGGGKLYTALLSALEQFVTANPAAAGATASATTATATAATPAAANTVTGVPAATTSGTGTTASSSASGQTTATAAGTLPQDLQAFLHDLAGALRHAGGGSGRHHADGEARQQTAAAVTTTATTPTATTAAAGATAGTASAASAETNATTAAAASATTATDATTATTAAAAASPAAGLSNSGGVAQYGQQDIITALKSLITDVSNSQLLTSASAASGASSSVAGNTVSALSQAFAKLVGDLGGSTAATGGAASTGTSAATGATGSTNTAAAPAKADTAALQSFLTGFLQDLQNGSSNATSTLGNTVNTTA